jgi:hypothetical protein
LVENDSPDLDENYVRVEQQRLIQFLVQFRIVPEIADERLKEVLLLLFPQTLLFLTIFHLSKLFLKSKNPLKYSKIQFFQKRE